MHRRAATKTLLKEIGQRKRLHATGDQLFVRNFLQPAQARGGGLTWPSEAVGVDADLIRGRGPSRFSIGRQLLCSRPAHLYSRRIDLLSVVSKNSR